MDLLTRRCGCGEVMRLLHHRDRTTACVACQRREATRLQAARPERPRTVFGVDVGCGDQASIAALHVAKDGTCTMVRDVEYTAPGAWAEPDPNCPRGEAHYRGGKWYAHPDSIAAPSVEPPPKPEPLRILPGDSLRAVDGGDPNLVDGVQWVADAAKIGEYGLVAFESRSFLSEFYWSMEHGEGVSRRAVSGYETTLLDARRAAVRAMREHEDKRATAWTQEMVEYKGPPPDYDGKAWIVAKPILAALPKREVVRTPPATTRAERIARASAAFRATSLHQQRGCGKV